MIDEENIDDLLEEDDVCEESLKEAVLPISDIAGNMNAYTLDDTQSEKIINGLTLLPQDLKRASYSDHTTGNDKVILVSDNVISLSALKKRGRSYLVSPQVNIIMNRGNEN